jgi:hypothetical protein
MKTPRVTDFDPDAKIPMLKSSLEDMPVIQRPSPPISSVSPIQEKTTEGNKGSFGSDIPTARRSDEATVRPTDRPTGKRLLVRRGFEWYEDQLAALKKLSLEEQMEGKDGSMSAMVREALDDYLKKRATRK